MTDQPMTYTNLIARLEAATGPAAPLAGLIAMFKAKETSRDADE